MRTTAGATNVATRAGTVGLNVGGVGEGAGERGLGTLGTEARSGTSSVFAPGAGVLETRRTPQEPRMRTATIETGFNNRTETREGGITMKFVASMAEGEAPISTLG